MTEESSRREVLAGLCGVSFVASCARFEGEWLIWREGDHVVDYAAFYNSAGHIAAVLGDLSRDVVTELVILDANSFQRLHGFDIEECSMPVADAGAAYVGSDAVLLGTCGQAPMRIRTDRVASALSKSLARLLMDHGGLSQTRPSIFRNPWQDANAVIAGDGSVILWVDEIESAQDILTIDAEEFGFRPVGLHPFRHPAFGNTLLLYASTSSVSNSSVQSGVFLPRSSGIGRRWDWSVPPGAAHLSARVGVAHVTIDPNGHDYVVHTLEFDGQRWVLETRAQLPPHRKPLFVSADRIWILEISGRRISVFPRELDSPVETFEVSDHLVTVLSESPGSLSPVGRHILEATDRGYRVFRY